jgi:hypothetical protein
MHETQDLFISHASADKAGYIEPLCASLASSDVTYWLDTDEISWGSNVPMRINEGLRQSTYVLLCLSPNFIKRRWPESELSAAFSVQTDTGRQRVLPLILEGKDQVLDAYPLLASLAYREYTGATETAKALCDFVGKTSASVTNISILVESVHTGAVCNLRVPPTVSLKWLTDRAMRGMGLSEQADTGAYQPFRVRWVLVDVRAETVWSAMPRYEKRGVTALVFVDGKAHSIYDDRTRLGKTGISGTVTMHMYAIEDENFGIPCASPHR